MRSNTCNPSMKIFIVVCMVYGSTVSIDRCMDIYRHDIMQYWIVPSSSILCKVNQSSTDIDQMGIQSFNGTMYISMKDMNVTMKSMWITERHTPDNILSIMIDRPLSGSRVDTALSIHVSEDQDKRGTFSLDRPTDKNSISRTTYFVSNDDIRYVGGRYTGIAISIISSITIVVCIVVSLFMRVDAFCMTFVGSKYVIEIFLYYIVPIQGSSSLITTSLLLLIPTTVLSIVSHNYRDSRYVLVYEASLLCVVVGSSFLSFDWYPIVVCTIYSLCVLYVYIHHSKSSTVSTYTYRCVSVVMMYVVSAWILVSSFIYFTSEIGLRIGRVFRGGTYYSQVREYRLVYWGAIAIVMCSLLILSFLHIKTSLVTHHNDNDYTGNSDQITKEEASADGYHAVSK